MTPEEILSGAMDQQESEPKTPDQILDEARASRENGAQGSLRATRDMDPDQAGKVVGIANRGGIDFGSAWRQREPLIDAERESSTRAILSRSPKLSDALNDSAFAAVARDDTDTLSAIEKLMRGDVDAPIGQLIKAGNAAREAGNAAREDPLATASRVVSDARSFGRSVVTSAPMMVGRTSAGYGELLDAYQRSYRENILDRLPYVSDALKREDAYWASNPELAAKIAPYTGPSALLKSYGGVGRRIEDQWRPEDQGFWGQVGEGLGQVAIQVALSIPTGGQSITALSFAGLGFDQQAESMKAAGVDTKDHLGQLTLGGGITLATEQIRLNRILKAIPASARKGVWRGIIGRIAWEGGEEGFQEIVEGLSHNALTMTYDEETRLIEGLAEAGSVGATVGAIFQAGIELAIPGKARVTVQHARPLSDELERMRTETEPTEGETKLSNLIDLAVQSKTAQRSPEKIEQYIAGMVDDATSAVAIDAEGLSQVIEDNQLDPESVMEELGLGPDALQKAAEEFGDVEVSTAKLAASKALKNGSLIKEHARFSSEAMTPAQREQRKDTDIDAMKQVFNDFLQGKVSEANADQSVTEQFMQRIEETGMYGNGREVQANATVMSSLIGSLAKVRGIAVEQAFEEHAPSILGHFGIGESLGGLDQAAQREITSERYDNPDLTESERKAVEMLFNGVPRATIEDEMVISPETLRVHLSRARAKGVSIENETGGHDGSIRAYAVELKGKGIKDEAIAERIRAKFGTGTTKGSVSSMLSQERAKIRNKGETPLFQNKSGPAGQFSPRDNIIHLFEAKNVSTLMHEASHWYFQTLLDLQARGQSTPEIDAMLSDIREWYDTARAEGKYDEIVARYDIVETGGKFVLTYEGEERGQFFSREEAEQKRDWREMHEAFAETFEVHLRDGKAPNAKLRDAFRFFRDFLTNLYRKVKGNPSLERANLNPEITAIFDRMLAVDDMVDGAATVMEIESNQMLQKMLDDGVLTEKEHARAVAKFPKMLDEMKEDLASRLWNSAQKRQDALMAGFKRDIRDAVAREYDASPVGRAEGMLGRNEWMGDVVEGDVDTDVEALSQAKSVGYQGENTGEAKEWLAARAKGLDMSTEARMARARAMGYDTETRLYHGTSADVEAFRTSRGSFGDGVYVTDAPDEAGRYARTRSGEAGGNVMPLFVSGKIATLDDYYLALEKVRAARPEINESSATGMRDIAKLAGEELQTQGFSGHRIQEPRDKFAKAIVVYDPSNIRSVNAAFDPDLSDSANLLSQAKSVGYQGENTGEAKEWLAARAKGLDMATPARMARAKEMGFGTENPGDDSSRGSGDNVVYHATNNSFKSFDNARLGQNTRANVTDFDEGSFANNLSTLGHWTSTRPLGKEMVAEVEMPLVLRGPKKAFVSLDELNRSIDDAGGPSAFRAAMEAEGFAGIKVRDEEFGGDAWSQVTFDPKNIRSVDAAFDPDLSDSANLLNQDPPRSLGAMTRMTDEQIGEWYVENIREVSQNLGDNYRVVNLHFKTKDGLDREDAVINLKVDGKKANADLFLKGVLAADPLKLDPNEDTSSMTPERKAEREAIAAEIRRRNAEAGSLFAKAGMALQHWARLEQPGVIVFSGSGDGQTKLYNFILSKINFDGYKNLRVDSIIGGVTNRDGEYSGDEILPKMEQFFVLREGENLGDYTDTENTKGPHTRRDIDGNEWRGYHVYDVRNIGPVLRSVRGDERGGPGSSRTDDGRSQRTESAGQDPTALNQTAYHGTDAKFDKFDANEIGSADGNMKFGWGFYFTNSRDVAGEYITRKGRIIKADIPNDETLIKWESTLDDQPFSMTDVIYALDTDGKIEALIDELNESEDLPYGADPQDQVERYLSGENNRDDISDYATKEQLDRLDKIREFDSPADETSGGDIYNITAAILGSKRAASEFFFGLGVKGVVADDATLKSGDKNYVVFDASDIRILDSNSLGPDLDALNQTITTHQDRADFLEHEAVSEPIEGEPKGSVRYGFKLPGQIEPVMVDVVVDPEYNAQQISIGEAIQDGAFNKDVTPETGLRDLAVRLYAIIERHIRKGPLFFRTTSAEDRAFTKEILTHAAENSAQNLRVHTLNNHTYLVQRPGTVSTSDGSVSNGGFHALKDEGRPSAKARAEFYRRARSHNGPERRREAVARRDARRESERGPVRTEKPNPLGSLFTPDPDALNQISDNPESFGLTPEQVESVNPIYRPEALPTERMASNQQAALWLEGLFTGEGITDFTIELTDKQIDEISDVMAAEAMLALQKTGSAIDWYSDAMMRAIDMASVKYPILKDDTAAELAGFGSASNARFAFTYIMAVTSQNLDVAANSIATDKAFSEMITRVADGDYSMPARWGTGDKQKAMGLNFEKFEKLIDAMPGGENGFPAKLAALDTMFRSSMTVLEWERFAKEEGIPFKAPGQTAKDAVVYGSSVLGPKIGNGFWQNLNGNFSPLTIDLWMRRTWGRLTGKSIGNPDALPAQRKRLADAVKRSRSREQGKPDHIAAIEAGIAATKKQLAGLKRSDFANKKEFSAEERRLKAELAASIETLADMANLKAPEAWKTQYNKSSNDLLAFAKRLLKVWDVEYNRLRNANGSVPAEIQPTWARAAKTIITNLAKPLDQVANGTQRKQIERAVKQALDKLDARGIELSTADLQAILWYPEKELWGALTDELSVDEDGVPIVEASSLNESYDTVWARILEGQGYEIPRTEGDGSGRGRGAGAVAGQDAGSGRPQDAGGIGQAGAAPFGQEGGRQGYGLTELDQKRRNPDGWGAVTPPSNVHPVRLDLKSVRDAYGDEAVGRLPRSVIERATSSNTVEDLMGQIETIKADLKAKPPKSLFSFVRSRGRKGKMKGPNGISGAADDLRALGLEELINEKSGRDIDYVRELAEEAGYLPPSADGPTTSINDLLEALQRELRGDPVYAEPDFADASAYENADGWRVFLDENDVDIYEEDAAVLEAAVRRFVEGAQEDAVTADEAADMFGFDTGEDLIAALIQEGDRERVIRDETERRFKEEYGDLYESGQLANEIEIEVNTELRARKAELEFEALTRAAGRLPARRLARQQAQESLSIMPIGEVNKRYKSWLRDAQTHGRNALAEAQKGNWDKVTTSKKYELVALAMHEEGAKLLERAEKVRADLVKYETSKYRREKIANDYLERIDAMLEGYELRKSKQGPSEQRRRQSAADYVAWMTAEGREDEIAAEASLLAEMANDKVWRNLTIDEADYLHATIRNLAHLGRTKDRLLNEQDKRRFNAVIDELVETLDEAGPLGKGDRAREKSHRPTLGEKASGFARTSHAWLMRLEHQFRALDGRENGPLWTALFRIFSEAADASSRMSRQAAKAVRAAYNIYSTKERYVMHNTSISLPELGPSKGRRWTKMDVISMALNWGVQYNRDALLEGYSWQAGQVEATLDRVMNDKDWDFVEAIWEEAGRYKDEAFALEKAMTGIEPKAVEGVSFTLPSGRVIEGKYYHIEYDSQQLGSKARRQQRQEDRQALSERGKSFTRPMTKNGGLIERTGSGGKPVRLHISVFEKSVMETIHDIAYRRAVIDASRIIRNDRFADAYEVTSGKEAYEQLMPWVEAIAKPPMEEVRGPAQVFVTLRRNLPIAYMGYKVGTAMIQVSGLAAAIPILGTARVAGGVAKAFTGGPLSVISAWQAVSEKSEFMRDRPMGYDRDVREITTAMGASNPLGSMKRNAFMLISAMDIGVSTPIWIAAYDKAMDGKAEGVARGDEEGAILWADSVVRRTQTAGRTQDLARVQRDSEFWKQLTMIYGYFGGLYGYTAQQVRSVRSGETNAMQFAWFATMLFVVVPLLAEAVAGRLVPDEDEDEETLASNAGRAVVSNFSGMFPVIRDAVNYQLKPQYGYNMSPVASGAEDVVRATTMFNDGEVTESEVKNAVRAIGGLIGLPSSQLVITGDYMWDVMNGDEDPLEDPVDALQEGLLRSKR